MTHSLPNLTRTALALTLALTSSTAMAQAVSADPEMINPRFGHNTIPGVPAADADVKNTVRFGTILQYQRNPVTGYRLDQEVGTIVANRFVAQLGVSWDFEKWGSLRFVLPVNVNSGTQIPVLDASGAGLGDIVLGASFLPLRTQFFKLGLQADLMMPSGLRNSYMGEGRFRVAGGLMMMGSVFEYFDILANASVMARAGQNFDTLQDFEVGPELWLNQGARLNLPWLPLSFTQSLVARGGFANFFQGGAENGLEVMGGVQYGIPNIAFNTSMTIDVMAGRGTNQGYGTTDFRLLGGVTFTRNPGKREKIIEIPPPPPPPPTIVPPPEEEPPPPEPVGSAIREKNQIIIRDPIEFFVDTADIRPHSLPVVGDVAAIINDDYRILHVVIEGHASNEGDFDYNYELSTRRAEAIYKQLILDGVHPDRISYKGWGEVRPKVEGETEEAWEVNRRAEFHIVAQYDDRLPQVAEMMEQFYTEFPYDPPPAWDPETTLPWNGQSHTVVIPESKAEIEAAKQAEEERKAEEQRRRDNFEDEESGDFDFEGTEEEPEEEDIFDGEDFGDDGGDDDGGFDMEGSEEPAPEPEPEVEETSEPMSPVEEATERVDEAVEEAMEGGTTEPAEASEGEGEEAKSPVEQTQEAIEEAVEEQMEDAESSDDGEDEDDGSDEPTP
jgi:outer membrane protein OmpA-like peptidoglycan-associated protein